MFFSNAAAAILSDVQIRPSSDSRSSQPVADAEIFCQLRMKASWLMSTWSSSNVRPESPSQMSILIATGLDDTAFSNTPFRGPVASQWGVSSSSIIGSLNVSPAIVTKP